jgi:hypothetical protein
MSLLRHSHGYPLGQILSGRSVPLRINLTRIKSELRSFMICKDSNTQHSVIYYMQFKVIRFTFLVHLWQELLRLVIYEKVVVHDFPPDYIIIIFDSAHHGLINSKDTKIKYRLYWCVIEFIDWRFSQSCWYFRLSFVNYSPSNR